MQHRKDLVQRPWLNLGNAVTATSGTVTASDPIGSNADRFYRVVVSP